jgi:hypothetical protein
MCFSARRTFARYDGTIGDEIVSLLDMTEKKSDQPTQKTQPKKGKPVEIPVPTRGDFKRDLLKIAPPDGNKKKR